MPLVAMDLPGIRPRQIDLSQVASLQIESKEVLLIAHRQQKTRLLCLGIRFDQPAVRPPLGDTAFRATEEALKAAVTRVGCKVIFAVAIEGNETAVRQVKGPRRAIFVLARIMVVFVVGRASPFLNHGAFKRRFENPVALQIGEVEHFVPALHD